MRFVCAAVMLVLAACAPSDRSFQKQLEAAQLDFDNDRHQAAFEAAQRALQRAEPGSQWHWRFRLLEAKAAYVFAPELVKELLREPCEKFPAIEIERKIVYANALIRDRDLIRAAPLLEDAIREADARSEVRLGLEARMGAARRLVAVGKIAEADRLLLEILARARKAGNTRSLSSALANLGFLRLRQSRFAEAIPFLEEAIKLTRHRKDLVYFNARNNLGICYARLGEFDRAIENQKEAIAGLERIGSKTGLLEAIGEAGATYYYRGSLDEAASYFERAYQMVRSASTEDAARIATNLATLQADRGDWKRAAELNSEAIAIKGKINAATLVYNTLNAAQIAAGGGEMGTARRLYLQVMDEKQDPSTSWRARLGLAQIAWSSKDMPAAKLHFEAAIHSVEASRSELEKADLRLSYFVRLIDFYQRYVDFLMDQGEPSAALSVVESSRAKVLSERAGTGAAAARLPASAYQRLASAADAVLLSYWLSPRASYLWVVTPTGIHSLPLPPRAEISAMVADYSKALLNQADPAANRQEAGDRLYRALIAPAAQWIPSGARVVVVPDGPLHNLNFETLPVYGSRPHYWIEDAEVSVAPSLAMMAAARNRPPAKRTLLLVGDPLSTDPAYPRLKHATREMDSIAAGFPMRILRTGADATPEGFLSSAPHTAAYLHFTAHSFANRDAPLNSAVVLSPGTAGRSMLYARDLMDLRLTAELVALSACRGAGARAYSGEGLVGFAWAFLRAGAARVIAGLWDVDDSATADLMAMLYEGIRKGSRPASALRDAKLALLRSQSHSKPYFWGPFQLYVAVK